ncbi:MAG: hypothetical protein AAB421_05415 [Patescibacteria group bacterium]
MNHIPVWIKQPGTTEPLETPAAYIVAQNGLFTRVKNDWVDAVVPVKSFPALEPETARAQLLLPQIPEMVFVKAVLFFHHIYYLRRTEAAVLLHFNKKDGWNLTIPKQQASYSHVRYDMTERIPGYRCVGTMHSHGNMSAFHSGIDTHDEASFDGVHITIGSLGGFPYFGMDPEVVIRGARFKLGTAHIAGYSGITTEQAATKMPPWFSPWLYRKDRNFLLHTEVVGDWKVPDDWVAKVEAPQRGYSSDAPNTASKPKDDTLTPPGYAPLPWQPEDICTPRKKGEGNEAG